jgi:hypothetical protein
MKVEHHKNNSYEFYQVYPFEERGSAITAYINSFDYKKNKVASRKEINWFCCGSCSVKDTEQFIKALQKAVELCKKGK